jgi:hypothetical protein
MSAWIPLFQTVVWVALIVFMLVFLRSPLRSVGQELANRINRGSGVEVSVGGWFKARVDQLQSLPHADPAGATQPANTPEPPDWTDLREEVRTSSRDVHLVHVIAPAPGRDRWFDIFAFLVGHNRPHRGLPADLSDVAAAEFFLGRMWGNRTFRIDNPGNGMPIGLSTSAYGPVLCICRVRFKDGHTTVLARYLDFEMSTVFTA